MYRIEILLNCLYKLEYLIDILRWFQQDDKTWVEIEEGSPLVGRGRGQIGSKRDSSRVSGREPRDKCTPTLRNLPSRKFK